MGKLTRFNRHILFLKPGLFLLLDVLEASSPARFQWMLHAFEEVELLQARVISRRGDGRVGSCEAFGVATLEQEGWFGGKAAGDFGQVEGWVLVQAGAVGQNGYGDSVDSGEVRVCGKAADGKRLLAGEV